VDINYFITGGAGFIGSSYVRMLLNDLLGPVARVKVFDKLTYAGSLKNLDGVRSDPRLNFIKGDICDKELVASHIAEGDIVINFAAESHVDRSIIEPSEFVRTNVLGTQVLLSLAVAKKVKLFLQVSTDEVYGSIESGSSSESDTLEPNSPYSASKAAADLLVRSYVQTYGLDARITRCCNNYGPGQYREKFIPLAIQCIRDNRPIPIYGDGKNIREWIHVEDHCRAIQLVLKNGKKGEVYNVGSGVLLENIEIARKLLEFSGKDRSLIKFVPDRLGHDFRYALNSEKIQSTLGFQAQGTFDITLAKLVNGVISDNLK
jgi:dTDP-glucose 4,6-dehydratase